MVVTLCCVGFGSQVPDSTSIYLPPMQNTGFSSDGGFAEGYCSLLRVSISLLAAALVHNSLYGIAPLGVVVLSLLPSFSPPLSQQQTADSPELLLLGYSLLVGNKSHELINMSKVSLSFPE